MAIIIVTRADPGADADPNPPHAGRNPRRHGHDEAPDVASGGAVRGFCHPSTAISRSLTCRAFRPAEWTERRWCPSARGAGWAPEWA